MRSLPERRVFLCVVMADRRDRVDLKGSPLSDRLTSKGPCTYEVSTKKYLNCEHTDRLCEMQERGDGLKSKNFPDVGSERPQASEQARQDKGDATLFLPRP